MRTKYTRVLMTLGIAFFGFLASPGLTHAQWTKANNGSKNISNCVLLTDGTVVCQEGETTSTLVRLTPDPFGSYSSGTWSDTNINPLPSGYAPRFFCSAVLADGRVVFTGGEYNDSSTGETNLGAILDPTANSGMGSWTTLNPPDGGASPWNQIGDSPCVILPNKKLLLGQLSTTQIAQLDPATLTWTDLSPTGKADGNAEEGFTLLPDGTILVVDTSVGFCGSGGECNITAGVGTTGEIYTPSTNAWAATATTGGVTLDGNVPNCCVPETGPQILRPDGTVIAIGATPNTASYNYLTGVWTAGPSFPTTVASYPTSTNCPATMATNYPSAGEADGPGSILPDGHVLVAASPVDSSGNEFHCASFFEFDGTNLNSVAGTPNAPNVPTFGLRMLVLPTGEVLVSDGSNDVELFNDGGTYLPAWQPTITSAPANIGQGETYPIFGTQFNGLSQGAAYGDDSEFATNYPLVRIVNNSSGHVFYARTHDHSTMGVATGSAIVSTNFDVPATLELGASTLVVVANGIPSSPLSINVGLGTALTYTGATSGDFNDPVIVQATLTASGGGPITGETVTFTLGSGIGTETCSMTTDGSGTASCPITPNQAAGTYTLNATFSGDGTYGASSASSSFVIQHEETAIAFTAASATTSDFDDAVQVQAQLTDPVGGAPIQGKLLTFVLGSGSGTETCSAATDPSGLAACQITPNQQAGPYTLTATFAQDAFYDGTSTPTPFTITKEETTVKFTSGSPTVIANGHPTTFSATLLEDGITPIQGRTINITIGTQSCTTGLTNISGIATCTIVLSQVLGPSTVMASFTGDPFYLPSSASEPVLIFAFLNSGSMVIGNLDAAAGTPATFWGAQWTKVNSLTGGSAPDAFKGFASTAPQACGGTWTSSPGASSAPPAILPSYMGVIASSLVGSSGSSINGNVPIIIVIKTNPGYAPNAGHAGTGTVVATFCP